MILLTFKTNDGLKLGIKTDAGVIDVVSAGAELGVDVPDNPTAFYNAGSDATQSLAALVDKAAGQSGAWLLNEADLSYGPCVPNPGKIICVGLNYRRHAEEGGMAIPTTPVLFNKFNNAIAAPGEGVPLPSVAKEYDYEAELVVVIGKQAKNVAEADALNHVLGYCNGHDVSSRDLQFTTSQWMLGKILDNFMPLGPYVVTSDTVGDPQKLQIRCWLNGELRQDSNTADMIFSVAEIVSYISRHMTLDAGDIITTGTPEGVIHGHENKVWMKPGDEVTIEVEGLGRLTNPMVAEG